MNYKFYPLAIKELEDAIDYYKNINVSLGNHFLEEIYSSIQRILKFPNAWSKLSFSCRRCILNKFPYGIIYQIHENEIRIIAVMQLNRNPNFWVDRL